jgi:hypothetical protein
VNDEEVHLVITERQMQIIQEQLSRAMHSIREWDRQDTEYYRELEMLCKAIDDQYPTWESV